MDNKFFGIGSTYRSTIPDAKRATGFGATQEPFEYINQALFELKTDHIIGTAAQLALNQCTCKYQSSDQTLRDSSGTAVTLTDGDRVYIIGLDTLTADFDLSAYDRLRVTSDPSIELANGSYNLEFGEDCYVDINVADMTHVTRESSFYGRINGVDAKWKYYTGAIDASEDFTISYVSGGGSLSTVVSAYARPYQVASGERYLHFYLYLAVTGVARTAIVFNLSGITFDSTNHGILLGSGSSNTTAVAKARAVYNSGNVSINHDSDTMTYYEFFGDQKLASKPTWED